jgi:hypothetical protein
VAPTKQKLHSRRATPPALAPPSGAGCAPDAQAAGQRTHFPLRLSAAGAPAETTPADAAVRYNDGGAASLRPRGGQGAHPDDARSTARADEVQRCSRAAARQQARAARQQAHESECGKLPSPRRTCAPQPRQRAAPRARAGAPRARATRTSCAARDPRSSARRRRGWRT